MNVHDTTHYYGDVVERYPVGNVEVLRYDSGEVRIRIVTTMWDDEVVVASLDISKHTVDWPVGGVPTISPSLLVNGGEHTNRIHAHFFITNGTWQPCGDDKSVPLPE